jgi:hypothetical protein
MKSIIPMGPRGNNVLAVLGGPRAQVSDPEVVVAYQVPLLDGEQAAGTRLMNDRGKTGRFAPGLGRGPAPMLWDCLAWD